MWRTQIGVARLRDIGPASALAASALLAACGWLPTVAPDWVTDRNPLPPCGEEEVGAAGGFDREARRCMLDAFESGDEAELISTMTSVEGDPITRILRVHANGTVELFVDASRDRFGSGEWERLRCERLVPVEEFNGPDLSFPPEQVFVEEACMEAPVP